MTDLLIRNLNEGVVAALQRRAAERRTSPEEEARRVLAAEAGNDLTDVLEGLDRACAFNGPQTGPTSTEWLRWDRDRDDRAPFEDLD